MSVPIYVKVPVICYGQLLERDDDNIRANVWPVRIIQSARGEASKMYAKLAESLSEINHASARKNPNNFHTIYYDKKPAGIVGYKTNGVEAGSGLSQIELLKEFRGKGILDEAYKKMAKKHGLNKLYASIRHDNVASVKSHTKSGFTELPEDKLEQLRALGRLGKKEEGTRFERSYS